MFIVPIKGDSIETDAGVKYTVLTYAAYKKQPAVYVETDNASTKAIPFSEITSVNGTPVSLAPGKVFTASSLIKRSAQLPQKGDKIQANGQKLKVKSLKLKDHGALTDGILLVCEDEDGKPVTVRMNDVQSLTQADGGAGSPKLKSVYKDYLGRSAK